MIKRLLRGLWFIIVLAFLASFTLIWVVIIKYIPGFYSLFGYENYVTKPEMKRLQSRIIARRKAMGVKAFPAKNKDDLPST